MAVAPASETARRPSRLVSTWVPLGFVALVPVFLLLGRSHQVVDPDTFWHIRAGDFLLGDYVLLVGPTLFSR